MTLEATRVLPDRPAEVNRKENGACSGDPGFSFQMAPDDCCMGVHETDPCCTSTAARSPSPASFLMSRRGNCTALGEATGSVLGRCSSGSRSGLGFSPGVLSLNGSCGPKRRHGPFRTRWLRPATCPTLRRTCSGNCGWSKRTDETGKGNQAVQRRQEEKRDDEGRRPWLLSKCFELDEEGEMVGCASRWDSGVIYGSGRVVDTM
ncbi:hypothetical protein BHE74_00024429 [Ensete ventricosum]|uniref:Uncharacterized protein n=1 Tax=Ensete ventricosum TaxID=4639 RepID=A0A444E6A7_ENSVE|nr:hypothetical protein GW17_00030768 [Ensete ventricosum]RWW68065.1 hypothetical protein BHE74_00024429 [Ensete ventricosum]RZR73865.1 hypothetical protein BHM03_00028963 [Ensete ventricosum]